MVMATYGHFLTEEGDVRVKSHHHKNETAQKATNETGSDLANSENPPKHPLSNPITADGQLAMEMFQKALKIDPNNPLTLMWYAKLLKKMGKMGQVCDINSSKLH